MNRTKEDPDYWLPLLQRHSFRVKLVAEELGISPALVYWRVEKSGLRIRDYTKGLFTKLRPTAEMLAKRQAEFHDKTILPSHNGEMQEIDWSRCPLAQTGLGTCFHLRHSASRPKILIEFPPSPLPPPLKRDNSHD